MTRKMLLILFVFTLTATAASITYNDLSAPAVVGVVWTNTDWVNQHVLFPKWDPLAFAGYHLDSVVFTLNAHARGDIWLTNSDLTSNDLRGTTNVTLTLSDLYGSQIVAAIPTFTTGRVTVPAQTTNTDSYTGDKTQASGSITSHLADYTGSGTVSLPVSAVAEFSFTSYSGSSTSGGMLNTQASTGGSVTYNYSADGVPEPAMLTLVGGGLLGLGFAARRRKKA